MISKVQTGLRIKGVREGLLVTLGPGDWQNLQTALLAHIEEQSGFFSGARLALDVGDHVLRAAELGALRDRLADQGVTLWAVLSGSPATEEIAQMLGLATRLSTPKPERSVKPFDTNLPGEAAVLVQRTLRSGFKVEYPGHIVVVGDVNPGAELVAGSSVVVWGRMRGVVHAGAEGNQQAVVCALDLIPTQLRIATIAAAPIGRKRKPQPEIARVQDGQIVIEAWKY